MVRIISIIPIREPIYFLDALWIKKYNEKTEKWQFSYSFYYPSVVSVPSWA
jgi:hypothetical protein